MRLPDRENALVYALWVFGILGALFLFREAWVTPINERDFAALWAAGKLAVSGHIDQVFDTEALRAAGAPLVGSKVVKLAYPYPPHALLIAVPLSLLPLSAAYVVWQSISAAMFYVAARPFAPQGFPKILAVLTPAALVSSSALTICPAILRASVTGRGPRAIKADRSSPLTSSMTR